MRSLRTAHESCGAKPKTDMSVIQNSKARYAEFNAAAVDALSQLAVSFAKITVQLQQQTAGPQHEQPPLLAALDLIANSLLQIEDLLYHDSGARWQSVTQHLPPGSVVESGGAQANFDTHGDPVSDAAHHAYLRATCHLLPYRPVDAYSQDSWDRPLLALLTRPEEWVKCEDRLPAPFPDRLIDHNRHRYGLWIEHCQEGSNVWFRLLLQATPAQLDKREMTANMREAEKRLVWVRNEIHRACYLLYQESKKINDLRRLALAMAVFDRHVAMEVAALCERHHGGLIRELFDYLGGQIDRFRVLREKLLERLLEESFPGKTRTDLFRKTGPSSKAGQQTGLYWWIVDPITCDWLVLANLDHPQKLIGRTLSGQERIVYRKTVWRNQAND